MSKAPYVVPSTTRRDLLIGLGLGAVVFAFIAFAVMNMGSGVVGKTLTGTITAKKFTPQPEEQITIGKAGIHTRKIDGEYLFEVRVGARDYNVWVDKKNYEAKKVGESFMFPRPTD